MKAFLVVALALGSTIGGQAQQFAASPYIPSTRIQDSHVLCGAGFTPSECDTASGMVRNALKDLRVDIPGWRWVVVPSARWNQLAQEFGIKATVPAFSSFALGSTYVKSSLVFPNLALDENLQTYTPLSGMERLRWMMAHESGHILCRTSDEKQAESAGKRLERGNREVCR